MTVEYACDYLLLVDSRDFGAHSLSSTLFPNASSELSLKTKIPTDVLRMAFDKLVKDEYYDYGEGGQKWIIILNDKGRWFREYGGYKQLKRDRDQEHDREMQRLVSQSVIDTNENVNTYTKWQFIISVIAGMLSLAAVIISLCALLKESPKQYKIRYPMLQEGKQKEMPPKSYMQEAWIYEDSMEP